MEKLALIRKEELDNKINLPRKNKIYVNQKVLHQKHQEGQIPTEIYFQGMRLLMLKDFHEYKKLIKNFPIIFLRK